MLSIAEQVLSKGFQPSEHEKLSIPISNCLTLDVHSNTTPHNLKIANLQKGLILNCDGKERIAEGAGFGFPVVVGPEETLFSGSANVTLSRSSNSIFIRKVFRMDRIARNKLGNVRLENRQTRAFVGYLCDFYQKNRHLRSLWLRKLLLSVGVEAAFEETESIGNVPVTYRIDQYTVNVQVDFSHLPHKKRNKVFVLNEQSASRTASP